MPRGSSISLENSEKVIAGIKLFIKDTNSAAGPILTEGITMIKDEAVRLAPRSKEGRRGRYPHPPGTLKKSIVVGSVYRGKAGVSQAIGIDKNETFTQGNQNQFYARFQEFGASGHQTKSGRMTRPVPANPYMRPASKKMRRKVYAYVRGRLKEELFNG
jgi:HK97 gp10 family phage protein